MNKVETTIFTIAEQLWLNDLPFDIKHDVQESPAIILTTKHWHKVETCPEEKIIISRFNTILYVGNSQETILELLYYNIKVEDERKAKEYKEYKDL